VIDRLLSLSAGANVQQLTAGIFFLAL